MTLYRRRAENVEAFHFEKALENMDGSYPFPTWLKEFDPLMDKQSGCMLVYVTALGYIQVKPGEWIVKDYRGNLTVVRSDLFDAKYEVVKG